MFFVPALVPLPLIIPLLMAALLAATSPLTARRAVETLAIVTAAVVTILCALLLLQATRAPIVYWFGGWRPRHGFALGVSFVIDPLGAGLATLAAALMTAALVFSWRYFDGTRDLYHVIMLILLAAMSGFCLTGDLFDMFVFFELMSVAVPPHESVLMRPSPLVVARGGRGREGDDHDRACDRAAVSG